MPFASDAEEHVTTQATSAFGDFDSFRLLRGGRMMESQVT